VARWLIFPLFIAELKAIIKLMKDRSAPKRYKAVVIVGLIYLFSPIDLIPLPVLGFSVVDDIVIWAGILYYLKEPLSKYSDKEQPKKQHSSRDAKRKFKGSQVVDADYEVVDEEKEKQDNE